jgi:hypothetical protein
MTPTVVTSRVGADGVLNVVVPLGPGEANREVRVTVEPIVKKSVDMTQEEWAAWVDAMAGTWQGDFERPPQGELEERDPLP